MTTAGELNPGFQPDDNNHIASNGINSNSNGNSSSNGNSQSLYPSSQLTDIELKNTDPAAHTPDKEAGKEDDLNTTRNLEDCGPPFLKLPGLNRFRNPKWFLVFLSFAAFTQGLCVNGLVNVVITSIERRFGLQSTQTGIIASSYDIGSLLVTIPVSYLGGRVGASKPRWIAFGMLLMGLGSLVWSLPHFAVTPYNRQSKDEVQMCGEEQEDVCLDQGPTSLSSYRFVFVLGQFLHGVGAAPLVILGTTFLDDQLDKHASSTYIAVFQTLFVVGPAVGYVVGGMLLSQHTDLIAGSGLSPSSSAWVGAWWPGFLLTFAMSTLCAAFIFLFPSSLTPRGLALKTKPESSSQKEKKVAELLRYTRSLFSNPTYMLISIAQAIDSFTIAGLSAFLPKYLENQFSLSGGFAAQLVGLIAVPSGGGGTFLGGFLIRRFKMNRTQILTMCWGFNIVAVIPFIISFNLNCDNLPYVGVNHNHTTEAQQRSYFPVTAPESALVTGCNLNCNCDTTHFDPVCGSDSLMYLSPCLAGCTEMTAKDNFTSCGCPATSSSGFELEAPSFVTRSKCLSDCGYLAPNVVLMFIGITFTFGASMPAVVATLRGVHPEERSVALGLQAIVLRLLGTIPGPVFYGYVLDQICILWETNCDESSSCLIYDNNRMALAMLGICLATKFIAVILYILASITSKTSKIVEEEDEKDS